MYMKCAKNIQQLVVIVITCCCITAVYAGGQKDRRPVVPGIWGGEGIRLTLFEKGATVEYDCAFGSITEPLLVDEQGRFEAAGVHSFESGGPSHRGSPKAKTHTALYHGRIDGSQMILTVILPETNKQIGIFSLRLGAQPLLEKCL